MNSANRQRLNGGHSSNSVRLKKNLLHAQDFGVPSEVRSDSLAARAYLEIRNKILKGDLPVGEALSRRKLALDLGISVPPITEALQRLEREGLLESKPRVGTRVRVPTPRDVEDRSLVREALETQAARLFAERATLPEKKALQ